MGSVQFFSTITIALSRKFLCISVVTNNMSIPITVNIATDKQPYITGWSFQARCCTKQPNLDSVLYIYLLLCIAHLYVPGQSVLVLCYI